MLWRMASRQPTFQFLSTNGDGTGVINAIGNYTVPDDFYMEVPAGQVRLVERLAIYVEDSTINVESYGALAALANGVEILYVEASGGSEQRLDGGQPIQANGDFAKLTEHVRFDRGPGNNALYAHIELGWRPLRLRPGGSLIVRLADDLTGLVKHTFVASWYLDGDI